MERAEIMSQILAILEDVAEISPEDVNENSVMMDDLDLSSMEILTVVADLEETFGLRIPEKELRNFVTMGDLVDYLAANVGYNQWKHNSARRNITFRVLCIFSVGKKSSAGTSSRCGMRWISPFCSGH